MPETLADKLFLVPLIGPLIDSIELKPKAGGAVLGRHEQCDVHLPADAEKVSRFHARLDHDGTRWQIADLGSIWGTFVNGVRLSPHIETPLSEGDLIRITPWTFSLSSSERSPGIKSTDDTGRTQVRTLTGDGGSSLASAMLALLLESAGAIHGAADEKQLAELLIDASIRGTGLQNAAVLRPVDNHGGVLVVASRSASPKLEAEMTFSRSLLAAASAGVVAELGGGMGDMSQSIMQLKISSAICVPLMLGGTVAEYLYLDSRGLPSEALRPGTGSFCMALGRIASLALANLKRVEMEKREASMRAELSAAAAAQKWIMPRRQGQFGPFGTIGENRSGQLLGGDFFDIIPLGANRLAVALGDVSGKGISASVLMTATQGFLHASLRERGDAGAAVTELNRFIAPRRPQNKFVTLWVGIFDANTGELTYVDAGHGYALLRHTDGTFDSLDKGGGPPVGIDESFEYASERVSIRAGDRVTVVSDGIIEQFGIIQVNGESVREQFRVEGLRASLASPAADEVAELFAAVIRHAGSDQLSDDATAVMVKWH